ncbi:hypothetical protein ACWD4J_19875 [Streptomyces sp. NPDC002577]
MRCCRPLCWRSGWAGLHARVDDPRRALLRLQLPSRPDPRSYRDWMWVACPITLPPTIPPGAVLHLPTLRIHRGRVRADLAYTHAVPNARRAGHTTALGVDCGRGGWRHGGLNTLLSAALGAGFHLHAHTSPPRWTTLS